MLEQKLALLARGVCIDGQTNAVSIFNIMEDFQVVGPVLIPEASFFALLARQDGDDPVIDATFRITLGAMQVASSQLRIDFADKMQTRIVIRIGGLPVPVPGDLKAELLNSAGKCIAHYEVTVRPAPSSFRVESSSPSAATIEQE